MEVRTDSEVVTPPTGLSNTVTIIAIVCGVVAVVFVLAVAAIIIAALKFVLKSRRRKAFDLRNRYVYIKKGDRLQLASFLCENSFQIISIPNGYDK